jgi:hypothetical protein
MLCFDDNCRSWPQRANYPHQSANARRSSQYHGKRRMHAMCGHMLAQNRIHAMRELSLSVLDVTTNSVFVGASMALKIMCCFVPHVILIWYSRKCHNDYYPPFVSHNFRPECLSSRHLRLTHVTPPSLLELKPRALAFACTHTHTVTVYMCKGA